MSNELIPGYKYLNPYSGKERELTLQRYHRKEGGLQLQSVTKGVVKQVVKNLYGTVFTVDGRMFIFKSTRDIDISPGGVITFCVLHEEGASELFVIHSDEREYEVVCVIQ